MKRPKLAIAGHITIDDIITDKLVEAVPGGSAPAVATSASHKDVLVEINSIIGPDFPDAWLNELESGNIDLSKVSVHDGKSMRVTMKYENQKIVDTSAEPGVAENFDLDFNENVDCLHICPMFPFEQERLVEKAKKVSNLVSVDFFPLYNKYYREHGLEGLNYIKGVDIIFPNDEEALVITKANSLVEAAKRFHNFGVNKVVITKGKNGVLFYDGNLFISKAAKHVDVVDTTGCGDSFVGSFLAEYLLSKDYSAAIDAGIETASLTAQKYGAWAPKKVTE